MAPAHRTRKQRTWRVVILTVVLIAMASLILTPIDAEPESKAGATTAVALLIALYVKGRWRSWGEEDRAAAPGDSAA